MSTHKSTALNNGQTPPAPQPPVPPAPGPGGGGVVTVNFLLQPTAQATFLAATGHLYLVRFNYALGDIATLIPAEFHDVELGKSVRVDNVDVLLVTRGLDGVSAMEPMLAGDIVAQRTFPLATPLMVGDAGAVVAALGAANDSIDRQWTILIRARGSTLADGTAIAPRLMPKLMARIAVVGGTWPHTDGNGVLATAPPGGWKNNVPA